MGPPCGQAVPRSPEAQTSLQETLPALISWGGKPMKLLFLTGSGGWEVV